MLTDNEKKIIEVTKTNIHLASEEGKSQIDQYLSVNEQERAYEILILEMIELRGRPNGFDKSLWRQLLLDFEIDKFGYDHKIMEKFEKWADS